MTDRAPAKNREYFSDIPNFQQIKRLWEVYLKDNKRNSLHLLGYLSLDIICSSRLTVLLKFRSRKTVHFSEQILSADKFPSKFSRQMKTIVYKVVKVNK